MRKALAFALVPMLAIVWVQSAVAQPKRETPYWASISAGKALMRTGPGKNYPAKWLYQRADLPVKVLEVYPSWRKVQDPDGETGWMLVNLLSDTRTALIRGQEPRPLREAPQAAARVMFRAEPGVVGRLSECANNWCRINVGGRRGFISTDHIWGTNPAETFEGD
jgi:SH3-like domain-containing protein